MLGQSKFEGLTLFQVVNQETVENVLITVAHYNCPVEDTRMGFTYIMLRDAVSVIRNQWEDSVKNFKVLDLLRDF